MKKDMNKFASWLCKREGLKSELTIGDAREVWRLITDNPKVCEELFSACFQKLVIEKKLVRKKK